MPNPQERDQGQENPLNRILDNPTFPRGRPWSQSWLYELYYRHEKTLSARSKSILDALFRGLGAPDQHFNESTCTPRQKKAARSIVGTLLLKERYANKTK